ncbi:Fic family protein [Desulfomicrobium norvegicum]|uniref:Fic family protein n=1 Tax=Desulfomicrobium norvegicum (strain DSM 1741 / NCIMB 8310) TaxID=52561 RepID=A0A8G2C2J1_DESNO|nr:Fic/DOC family N-terminal domain-containing protein [Desulfomicrobium norvegicum]SFL66109.1 Fic family protein [Desulfomicrobium norvegicum]
MDYEQNMKSSSPVHYHSGEFPPKRLEWDRLIPLLGSTSAALARYDGILNAIPNATVLLSPMMTQEAVLTSRIEGTQATMGEVLEFEAGIKPKDRVAERTADIQEVLNYRKAMHRAVELMDDLPLCQRVLKEAHSVLMKGVRGKSKSPGEYRKVPNWIGSYGCSIEEAKYVPISADKLPEAMGRWEQFIHADYQDRLVQLAILHAEFEALHPFLDGNGRLGRMFVPLYLCSINLLQRPMFYISAYLEARRDEYYERLLAVSRVGDWTGWCQFFLEALQSQAEENLRKAKAILVLYEQSLDRALELIRSQHAKKAMDFIFSRPIFSSSSFNNESGIPKATAIRILKVLRDNDFFMILEEQVGSKPAVLGYEALLVITEGMEERGSV